MIIRSPYPDVEIPNVPLVPFVLRRAAELGDKPALVCGATGRRYSYAELARAVRQVAAGLAAHGIRKGDVVGLVSPNHPDFAVMFYAVATLGAICSTVNPVATSEEIGVQFADSRAVMLVTIPELFDKCQVAAAHAGTVRAIVVFGEHAGATAYASLFTHGETPPPVDIDPDTDIAVLPYSSGTSGVPKGVMLTHRNLVANLCQMTGPAPLLTSEDRVVGVLPFFHIYGMVVVMGAALVEGATVVTMPRFELEPFLQLLQDHRITYANIVPPILVALAKHPVVARYDLSALVTVFSGAAPLGAELSAAVEQRLGVRVRQGYGLTETSPVTHFHPLSSDVVLHDSVGPLVPNTSARLVDPVTGEDVAVGERGEVWIHGPQVMRGYFNKPEATADCLTADGWFRTGDVGVIDDRGWFRIVDRVKELIKYKGMQVAPAELEAVLLAHPAVADAAVIPVPDADAGEIPKAYIVQKAPVTSEDIMTFVAERVSPYKKIRRVEFVDSIPKSASGKILRRLLVERERQAAASS